MNYSKFINKIRYYKYFDLNKVFHGFFLIPPKFIRDSKENSASNPTFDPLTDKSFIHKTLKNHPEIRKHPWIKYSENYACKLIRRDCLYTNKAIIPKDCYSNDNLAIICKIIPNDINTTYYIFSESGTNPKIIHNTRIPVRIINKSYPRIICNRNYLLSLEYYLEDRQLKYKEHSSKISQAKSHLVNLIRNQRNYYKRTKSKSIKNKDIIGYIHKKPKLIEVECMLLSIYEKCRSEIQYAHLLNGQIMDGFTTLRMMLNLLFPSMSSRNISAIIYNFTNKVNTLPINIINNSIRSLIAIQPNINEESIISENKLKDDATHFLSKYNNINHLFTIQDIRKVEYRSNQQIKRYKKLINNIRFDCWNLTYAQANLILANCHTKKVFNPIKDLWFNIHNYG